jgi:hypothetical protein
VVVALFLLVGVPIWLVVGMLGAGLWARRRFTRLPAVFKCKLRTTSGAAAGVDDHWPRLPVYARWVHDVLLVHRGVALVRNIALPVAAVTAGPAPGSAQEVNRLGNAPVVLTARLDSGAVVQVAANRADAVQLAWVVGVEP